jgi:SulP family sulfate permease
VYSIVHDYGIANLIVCTIASGFLLLLMGVMRIGALIRFIPVAIVIGFTNGIAVLILLSQVKDFLGLSVAMPEDFFEKIIVFATNITDINIYAVVLSVFSVLLIRFWPTANLVTSGHALAAQQENEPLNIKHNENAIDWTLHLTKSLFDKTWKQATVLGKLMLRIPAPLAVLVLTSVIVILLKPFGVSVETIGSRFGEIPQGLPSFELPAFSWGDLRKLASPTITIALLGAIESLLSARVADAQTDDRHDPNQELIAQGIANIVTPFFGGIPSTGAIARTATNIRAGAFSPISGIIHSVALLLVVLIAAPLASYIPLSALCAILVIVSFNMGDWRAFVRMQRFPLNYRIILVTTFILTVVFGLTLAVEVGLILSSLFFIFRVSRLTKLERISADRLPPNITAFKLSGSLFFGAVGKIEFLMSPLFVRSDTMILDMRHTLDIDDTGLDALTTLQKTLKKRGGNLILCDLTAAVKDNMSQTGFLQDVIGDTHVLKDFDEALLRYGHPPADLTSPTPS